MNYIQKLQAENKALKEALDTAIESTTELLKYYNSDKFFGKENDYAHVTTDVYPKVLNLKSELVKLLNNAIKIR